MRTVRSAGECVEPTTYYDCDVKWPAGRAAVPLGQATHFDALLSLAFGLISTNGGKDDTNRREDLLGGPHGLMVEDSFRVVHQPLDGNGSIVARVTSQDAGSPDAASGIMIKNRTRPGSSYASLTITPRHGLRLGAIFDTDVGTDLGAMRRVAAPHP